jgi:hypothetical protein
MAKENNLQTNAFGFPKKKIHWGLSADGLSPINR